MFRGPRCDLCLGDPLPCSAVLDCGAGTGRHVSRLTALNSFRTSGLGMEPRLHSGRSCDSQTIVFLCGHVSYENIQYSSSFAK